MNLSLVISLLSMSASIFVIDLFLNMVFHYSFGKFPISFSVKHLMDMERFCNTIATAA